jgi:hypothetical protein
MLSKETNIVTGAFTYTFFLIIISFIIVTYSSALHAPYLESDNAIIVDKAITTYLISGKEDVLPTMTTNELNHLKDVKRLLFILTVVAVLLLKATLFCWFNKSPLRKARLYFAQSKEKLTAQERLVFILTPFGVLSFLSFAQFFILGAFHDFFMGFHLLFFPQGNFLFPMTSVLISTYPESFFLSMTVLAITLFASFSALFGLIYIVNFIRRKNNIFLLTQWGFIIIAKR